MINIFISLINCYWIHNPNSYKIGNLGEDTIFFEPPKLGEDTYVAFLNPENFSTNTATHLEPVYKNICSITIKSSSKNATLYFSFIKIDKGFCGTVDFYYSLGDRYDILQVSKYANACIIYPTWEGIDFNFFKKDPFGTSEFFDSDSSQRSPYFAFNLIHKFERNRTINSDYFHRFGKFEMRSPVVINNFHVWHNEKDKPYLGLSDTSYNVGATVCPSRNSRSLHKHNGNSGKRKRITTK
ncbi:hypothetical protein TVAG_296400 [Trichomonas vaginalis G3]|uniref:Uncharacterized protein n=1 Tax=Trichomonas vaginalis (strain ATCC PRA-98 / G3) TaxID=412133 RepID=A2F788_TRIV3|nr:hypothetical protein TVAGG3_0161980 [Trichomonas vaginalis G3]EAX99255.1 hypothetical protein TVAG_296400 [Trichomonas vaginalis G3]KAI5547926.1 hypothetical protein TVAGG3_0161980 [Trichomonas vaginalis G3]|eukprot:XP_001312185.1 hypothetical protein [Trichomonas vaginalis G3]